MKICSRAPGFREFHWRGVSPHPFPSHESDAGANDMSHGPCAEGSANGGLGAGGVRDRRRSRQGLRENPGLHGYMDPPGFSFRSEPLTRPPPPRRGFTHEGSPAVLPSVEGGLVNSFGKVPELRGPKGCLAGFLPFSSGPVGQLTGSFCFHDRAPPHAASPRAESPKRWAGRSQRRPAHFHNVHSSVER